VDPPWTTWDILLRTGSDLHRPGTARTRRGGAHWRSAESRHERQARRRKQAQPVIDDERPTLRRKDDDSPQAAVGVVRSWNDTAWNEALEKGCSHNRTQPPRGAWDDHRPTNFNPARRSHSRCRRFPGGRSFGTANRTPCAYRPEYTDPSHRHDVSRGAPKPVAELDSATLRSPAAAAPDFIRCRKIQSLSRLRKSRRSLRWRAANFFCRQLTRAMTSERSQGRMAGIDTISADVRLRKWP